jgi:predicted metal-dependent HD superfamily phosphohydrolase
MMRVIEPPEPLINDLKRRYAEPQRFYHTWAHVEALLTLFETHKGMVRDPTRVLWAIYYHDAIYDPMAKDNEERSASLLRQVSGSVLPDAKIVQIERLIMATVKHEMPEDLGFDVQADCATFLDFDLAIFAAADDVFDAYEEGVRKEYSYVPEPAFRAARKQVLEGFLNRSALYFSPMLARQWEPRARANLARSIARLSEPAPPITFTPPAPQSAPPVET